MEQFKVQLECFESDHFDILLLPQELLKVEKALVEEDNSTVVVVVNLQEVAFIHSKDCSNDCNKTDVAKGLQFIDCQEYQLPSHIQEEQMMLTDSHILCYLQSFGHITFRHILIHNKHCEKDNMRFLLRLDIMLDLTLVFSKVSLFKNADDHQESFDLTMLVVFRVLQKHSFAAAKSISKVNNY